MSSLTSLEDKVEQSPLGGDGSDGEQAIQFTYADPSHNLLQKAVIRTIEGLTGQPKLKRLYLDHQKEKRPDAEFFDAAVTKLRLTVDFDEGRLQGLPRSGPLVVVANHPYGVVDGILICWLVSQVRPDFKILTNAVLCQAPELQDYVLPVDFSGTAEALATNLRSRAEARDMLKAGETVIVFPGGGVANTARVLDRSATDLPWQPFTSHLIRQSRATVAPFYFFGQNSRAFQLASHVSPVLRLSLLFNEVRRLMGTTIRVGVGDPIPFEAIEHLKDREALALHLRQETLGLSRLSGNA